MEAIAEQLTSTDAGRILNPKLLLAARARYVPNQRAHWPLRVGVIERLGLQGSEWSSTTNLPVEMVTASGTAVTITGRRCSR